LPKLKSSIVTESYITQVITNQIYCPKYSDIRLAPCPRPPDKQELIKLVLEHCRGRRLEVGITDDHAPDKKWLIDFCSTHIVNCHIFKKGYLPPPKASKISVNSKLEMPKDFMEGLPPSRKKVKAKRLQLITKGKLESHYERIKQLKERYAKEVHKAQNKIDVNKSKQSMRSNT